MLSQHEISKHNDAAEALKTYLNTTCKKFIETAKTTNDHPVKIIQNIITGIFSEILPYVYPSRMVCVKKLKELVQNNVLMNQKSLRKFHYLVDF